MLKNGRGLAIGMLAPKAVQAWHPDIVVVGDASLPSAGSRSAEF
jgi:hypothetical protein